MEAMTELCDLIAQNPNLFSDKLSWICSRCPPPHPHSVTPSHLHAITALARFLSKSPSPSPSISTVRSTLLSFLSSIKPLSFRLSFWPQSYSLQTISLFFSDLLRYLSAAADLSPDFSSDISLFFGDIVVFAVLCGGEEREIATIFLSAVARNCPAVSGADAERLVSCLVEQFAGEEEVSSSGSENSMSWGSNGLWKGKAVEDRDVVDDGSSESSSVQNGGGGEGSGVCKAFEVESVEGLEKMEMAFRLVRQVLDRAGGMKGERLERFYRVAAKQLKSLPGFLKYSYLRDCMPEVSSSGSENSMSWGSNDLYKGKAVEDRDVVDGGSSEVSSVQNGGIGEGSNLCKAFEVEYVEGLEKMDMAFRLVWQVLDRAGGMKAERLECFL